MKFNIFYKKRIKIKLIRPLLELKRLEILKLCNFWVLPVCVDTTNNLFNFRRNRIRHQVFPILRIFFNPKLDDSLAKFIQFSNFENYYLMQQFSPSKLIIINSDKYGIKRFTSKLFSYLPLNLYKKLYYHLSVAYFQHLTFYEIVYLLKLNTLYLE